MPAAPLTREEKQQLRQSTSALKSKAKPYTLTGMFETLQDANVKYVLLENYHNMPSFYEPEKPLVVLVDNEDLFLRVLNLERVDGQRYLMRRPSSSGPGSPGQAPIEFVIREKGHNFLARDLEGRLLSSRIRHNQIVYVPDPSQAAFYRLYVLLYHQNWMGVGSENCNPEARKELMVFLEERIGVAMRSGYKDIKFSGGRLGKSF